MEWYTFAAESGHAPAQNNLGRLLMANPCAEAADTGTALAWLQAAAEQGSAAAWFNMGMYFEWGVGNCAVDFESAQECYWHAAQQGHQAALLRLEQMQQASNTTAPAALGSTRSSTAGKHCLKLSNSTVSGGHTTQQQEQSALKAMHQVLVDLQLLTTC
jgi:TPR repeat protein